MEIIQNKFVKTILVLLALFLLALTFKTFKEYRYVGAGVYPANTVTISGEGEVFAVPDVAQFSFTVETEAQTMEAAQAENAETINAIIAYLEDEADIEDRDVKTTGYNSYPRYEWRNAPVEVDGGVEYLFNNNNNQRVLVGYVVTQSVSVKVRDTEEAGTVLAEISSRGATNVSGLNFTIDDQDELELEARGLAIKDARKKAEVLARQLGVKVVGVVSFYEEDYYGYGYGGDRMMAMDAVEQSAPVAPELPVGENQIRSRVSVTFEIR